MIKRALLTLAILISFATLVVSRLPSAPASIDEEILPLQPPISPLVIGEIASFEAGAGLESFKTNREDLDVVNTFLYDLASDGSVVLLSEVDPKLERELLSISQDNGPDIMLGIGNDYDAQRLDLLLTNSEVQEEHIAQIVDFLTQKGYVGVVVNFENLRNDQTVAFTAYIRALSTAVRSQEKMVAVSLNTKLQGRVFEGIDIVEVSKVVDRIEFNAYEEFGAWSGSGPIASLGWVDAIVRNIIAQGVSPTKIVLGTAQNGHDWLLDSHQELVDDITSREMLSLASFLDAQLIWDEKVQSYFFNYTDQNGTEHVVWLEEARSFESKLALAERYNLHGVALWFLGGEDPKVWEILDYFNSLN